MLTSWLSPRRKRPSPSLECRRLEDRVNPARLVYAGTGGPVAPDAVTDFALSVPTSMSVGDVDVTVSLGVGSGNPVSLALVSPAGTVVPLIDFSSFDGDGLIGTVFDDSAGPFPYQGSSDGVSDSHRSAYRPAGSEKGLAALVGERTAGAWTLRVTDGFGISSGANLAGWSISLRDTPTPAAEASPDLTGALGALPLLTWTMYAQPTNVVQVPFSVTNAGAAASAAVDAAVVMTTGLDTQFGDTLATVSVPALAPGESFAGTMQVPMPSEDPMTGLKAPYWAWRLAIDPGAELPEADRTDNSPGVAVAIGHSPGSTGFFTTNLPGGMTYRTGITVTQAGGVSRVAVNAALSSFGSQSGSGRSLALIAPDGTRRALIYDTNPASNSTLPYSYMDGADPSTGSFPPVDPLVELRGMPAAGVWVLEAVLPTGGTLNDWDVNIETTDTLPDPVISGLRFVGLAPLVGDPFTVAFEVTNRSQTVAMLPDAFPDVLLWMGGSLGAIEGVTTVNVPPLGPGESATLSFVVTPSRDPLLWEDPRVWIEDRFETLYVGLTFDPYYEVVQQDERDNFGQGRGIDFLTTPVLHREAEDGMSIGPRSRLAGVIDLGESADWERVTVPRAGYLELSAERDTLGLDPTLGLFTSDKSVILQTEGTGGGPVRLRQYLEAGEYFVRVGPRVDGRIGSYVLTTTLTESAALTERTNADAVEPSFGDRRELNGGLAVGDLTGDGVPDVVMTGRPYYSTEMSGFKYGLSGMWLMTGTPEGSLRTPVDVMSGDTSFYGYTPIAARVADMDGDGDLDLLLGLRVSNSDGRPQAFSYWGAYAVAVLENRGDGSFTRLGAYNVPAEPKHLTVADLDGDGKADVIVSKDGFLYGGLSVRPAVLWNRGDGRLLSAETLVEAAGVDPTGAARVGDIDGDGKADIVIGDIGAAAFSVYRGLGNRRFAEPTPVGTGGSTSDLAVADFDRDGRDDVLIATAYVNRMTLYGSRSVEPVAVPVSQSVALVRAADWTGDGEPDLVTLTTDGRVEWFANDGMGVLTLRRSDAPTGRVGAFELADLSQDGTLDLVTFHRGPVAPPVNVPLPDVGVQVTLTSAGGRPVSLGREETRATPDTLLRGDWNLDGREDIVAASGGIVDLSGTGVLGGNLDILLGRGDGTFQPARRVAPAAVGGDGANAVASADLNRDGRPDLAFTRLVRTGPQEYVDRLTIALGLGDGSFTPVTALDLAPFTVRLEAADVDGDRLPDLVAVSSRGVAQTLRNLGAARFAAPVASPVLGDARDTRFGDVTGDGVRDLVLAVGWSLPQPVGSPLPPPPPAGAYVYAGSRDGSFALSKVLSGGVSDPAAVELADLTGDGKLDIVIGDAGSPLFGTLPGELIRPDGRGLHVFAADGAGGFLPVVSTFTRVSVFGLTAFDPDGDGDRDLFAVTAEQGQGWLFANQGTGTLAAPQRVGGDLGSGAVVAGDFNADAGGRADDVALAVDLGVRVLTRSSFGLEQSAVAGAELTSFNGLRYAAEPFSLRLTKFAEVPDGKGGFDTVPGPEYGVWTLVNDGQGATRLGVGRANAEPIATIRLDRETPDGPEPLFVLGAAGGDLDGDGSGDIVVLYGDFGTTRARVYRGDGLGGFTLAGDTELESADVSDIVVADADGDGDDDLFAVTSFGNVVPSVRLWNATPGGLVGGRTFTRGGNVGVRHGIAVADFTGDGAADVLVETNGTASVWASSAGGHALIAVESFIGSSSRLSTADADADGRADLLVPNADDQAGRVRVLRSLGDGTFTPFSLVQLPERITGVTLVSVNGDGSPDLAVSTPRAVTRYLGGDGVFRLVETVPVDTGGPLLALDGDADGVEDLIVSSGNGYSSVTFLRSAGLRLGAADVSQSVPPEGRPVLAQLIGDATPDAVTIDRQGRLLVRAGRAAGGFGTPELIKSPPLTDIVSLSGADGRNTLIGVGPGGKLHAFATDSDVKDGWATWVATGSFLATRLLDADVDGDGLEDLLVGSAFDHSVSWFRQTRGGDLVPLGTLAVGLAPSALAVRDVDGDGRADILATGLAGGDVTVVYAADGFTTSARYRAGPSPSLAPLGGTPDRARTLDQTLGVVVANGANDGTGGVLTVNRQSRTIVRLDRVPGGFADARIVARLPQDAGAALGGDFNRDGRTDVAVLFPDSSRVGVWLGTADGLSTAPQGTFATLERATGIDLCDRDGDGMTDLVVANAFGDVVILFGDGSGGFAPRFDTGDDAPLAVLDVTGDGRADALVADQSTGEVTVYARSADDTLAGSGAFTKVYASPDTANVKAPGAVRFADLDADGVADFVVASGGSNRVLVYAGTGNGSYAAPVEYVVGTDPAAVEAADLNGDGVLDLAVANRGSNDVSVLFGTVAGGSWSATAGPRLETQGDGPTSVRAVSNASGGADLAILTNEETREVVLKGLGDGFFDDRNPVIMNISAVPPIAVLVSATPPAVPGVPPALPLPPTVVTPDAIRRPGREDAIFVPLPGQTIVAATNVLGPQQGTSSPIGVVTGDVSGNLFYGVVGRDFVALPVSFAGTVSSLTAFETSANVFELIYTVAGSASAFLLTLNFNPTTVPTVPTTPTVPTIPTVSTVPPIPPVTPVPPPEPSDPFGPEPGTGSPFEPPSINPEAPGGVDGGDSGIDADSDTGGGAGNPDGPGVLTVARTIADLLDAGTEGEPSAESSVAVALLGDVLAAADGVGRAIPEEGDVVTADGFDEEEDDAAAGDESEGETPPEESEAFDGIPAEWLEFYLELEELLRELELAPAAEKPAGFDAIPVSGLSEGDVIVWGDVPSIVIEAIVDPTLVAHAIAEVRALLDALPVALAVAEVAGVEPATSVDVRDGMTGVGPRTAWLGGVLLITLALTPHVTPHPSGGARRSRRFTSPWRVTT